MKKCPTKGSHEIAVELAKRIKGRVNDTWDPEYKQAVQIDNGRITHEPMLVAVPEYDLDGRTKPQDPFKSVCEIVKFCQKQNLRLTAKSGGHSAAGYCLNTNGVVLDLRRFNKTQLDPATGILTLGAGCRWRQVYDFLETGESGLIPVGGGCPGVGVGGFLLGGGYSFLSRSYGLGCDNMKSVTIVDKDGMVHKATKKAESQHLRDLFWASCGGGGGNFGVAVEFEVEAKRPPFETMLMGEVVFPFYRVDEILPFYNEWVKKLPREMAVYGRIANIPDPRNAGERILTLLFTTVYNGPFSEGIKVLDGLLKLVPIRVEFQNMTIHEWEDYIGSRTSIAGRSAYIRSLMLPVGAMTEKVAYTLKKYMSFCPSPETFIVWTHAGGAVSSIANAATAFAHRDALFIPEIKAIWDFNKPEETSRNVEWAYKFFEELAESSTATGAYVNYIDPLLTGWKEKYHGSNYARLLEIKRHWDPNSFFHFQQGIGSDFEPNNYIKPDDRELDKRRAYVELSALSVS
ncbi:MAG: FAD-binding oxidoreductase [Verrucomicrobiota bacterium]